MERKDVTNCPLIGDEGRGVNEKEWREVDGKTALFKETQIKASGESTYADYAEAIVEDICKALGVDCAKVELAIRDGKEGCLSYSFLDGTKELYDISVAIQKIWPDFDSKMMKVRSTKENYTLEMILEGLRAVSGPKRKFDLNRKRLLQTILVDSIVDQYDRNPSNLSILTDESTADLSPMYDNGTSLSMSLPLDVVDVMLREVRKKQIEYVTSLADVEAVDLSNLTYTVSTNANFGVDIIDSKDIKSLGEDGALVSYIYDAGKDQEPTFEFDEELDFHASEKIPASLIKGIIQISDDYHREYRQGEYGVISKIGYLDKKFVDYPSLETYIFNYYFGDVKYFIGVVKEVLTPDKIMEILNQDKYKDLPQSKKRFISIKLHSNLVDMQRRFEKISNKARIDKVLRDRNACKRFGKALRDGTLNMVLPEFERCMNVSDNNPDYDTPLNEQVNSKLQSIIDINALATYFKIPMGAKLDRRQISLLKWTSIFEAIKKADPEHFNFKEMQSRLGFLQDDTEIINTLINNRFVKTDDIHEAYDLIYGEDGIGEKNIDMYIAKKFVDSLTMKESIRYQRKDEIRAYAETLLKVKKLHSIICEKENIFRIRNLVNLGIKDTKEIEHIQIEAANYYLLHPEMKDKELLAYLKELVVNRANENRIKVNIDANNFVFINKDEYEDVNNHTITLENGKRLALYLSPTSLQDVASKMGIEYFAQILDHPSGNGVTVNIVTRKGVEFPKEFLDYARKFYEANVGKMDGKALRLLTPECLTQKMGSRLKKSEVDIDPERLERKKKGFVSCFRVTSLSDESAKIPDVTAEEFSKELVEMLNDKKPIKPVKTNEEDIIPE